MYQRLCPQQLTVPPIEPLANTHDLLKQLPILIAWIAGDDLRFSLYHEPFLDSSTTKYKALCRQDAMKEMVLLKLVWLMGTRYAAS